MAFSLKEQVLSLLQFSQKIRLSRLIWRSLKLQLMKKLKQLLLIHLTILQVMFTQSKQLKKCVTF